MAKKPSLLVTAGPTRERIDPVRYISNESTGTFGYEIAAQAARRGWRVTLVSGPVSIKAPQGVKLVRVESAVQMGKAVSRAAPLSDIVIMAAAVSDWRVAAPSARKIKRGAAARTLKLVENPDILGGLGKAKKGKILVGFALETEKLEHNAVKKLNDKRLDLIVANRWSAVENVFGNGPTSVFIADSFGHRERLRGITKARLAGIILDKVSRLGIKC